MQTLREKRMCTCLWNVLMMDNSCIFIFLIKSRNVWGVLPAFLLHPRKIYRSYIDTFMRAPLSAT
jgi:hypothetical protein